MAFNLMEPFLQNNNQRNDSNQPSPISYLLTAALGTRLEATLGTMLKVILGMLPETILIDTILVKTMLVETILTETIFVERIIKRPSNIVTGTTLSRILLGTLLGTTLDVILETMF